MEPSDNGNNDSFDQDDFNAFCEQFLAFHASRSSGADDAPHASTSNLSVRDTDPSHQTETPDEQRLFTPVSRQPAPSRRRNSIADVQPPPVQRATNARGYNTQLIQRDQNEV